MDNLLPLLLLIIAGAIIVSLVHRSEKQHPLESFIAGAFVGYAIMSIIIDF